MTLPGGRGWYNLFHAGSVVAAGREASKEAISAVPVLQLYESFLVWRQNCFSEKAEAAVGILSGFL